VRSISHAGVGLAGHRCVQWIGRAFADLLGARDPLGTAFATFDILTLSGGAVSQPADCPAVLEDASQWPTQFACRSSLEPSRFSGPSARQVAAMTMMEVERAVPDSAEAREALVAGARRAMVLRGKREARELAVRGEPREAVGPRGAKVAVALALRVAPTPPPELPDRAAARPAREETVQGQEAALAVAEARPGAMAAAGAPLRAIVASCAASRPVGATPPAASLVVSLGESSCE
jgi:hypothetical protein